MIVLVCKIVGDEVLRDFEVEGVMKKVVISEWVGLIVIFVKKDGSVRVCVDFKVIINL